MKSSVRHVASFSGGKDSTAMVLRLIEEGWPLDEIVFFDTGWEFPQMYEHLETFEAFTGWTVTRLHPKISFVDEMLTKPIVARKGPLKGCVHRIGHGWPSFDRRWCTRRKIDGLMKGGRNQVRYIGIAADEIVRIGAVSKKNEPEKRYPLLDWHMNEADCLAYCRERGFDWGGLYDIFTRVSCYCCPLKRIGDYRKLRWHFRGLWAQMLEWDAQMGNHNKGFRGYHKVIDLERRFKNEDCQMTMFKRG